MKLVFVISNSPVIGNTIEAFLAEFNSLGKFNLNPQRVNYKTISGYDVAVSETEKELLKLIFNCEEEVVARKFSTKNMKVVDFFKSIDEKKFKTLLRPNIEGYLGKALSVMALYQIPLHTISKSKDDICEIPLIVQRSDAEVFFNFKRHSEGISYRMMIKLHDELVKLTNKNIVFITHKPCWIIVNNTLLHFDDEIDSFKLLPFVQKEVVEIPNSSVDIYVHNFIQKIFRKFEIETEGITQIVEEVKPIAVLNLDLGINSRPVLALSFDYKGNVILMSKSQHGITECQLENDTYVLSKIKRDYTYEYSVVDQLYLLGLKSFENVHFFYPSPIEQPNLDTTNLLVSTICLNYNKLIEMGFQFQQSQRKVKYFFGQIDSKTVITENNDWFDVSIDVVFGDFTIPFVKLRHHILNKVKEYELPDGTIAIIPEEWFAKYDDLVKLGSADSEKFKIKKYHVSLLNSIDGAYGEGYKNLLLDKDAVVAEIQVPSNLKTTLRPYQYEGFKWLKKLETHNFSGCLADDMGLGKTIQTIAVLLESHNKGNVNTFSNPEMVQANHQLDFSNRASNEPGKFVQASLIVVPLSLIFNWQQELQKFAPSLLIYTHTGLYRSQSASVFHLYDIVLTTYGMVRNDIDMFKKYNFTYVVLDESQNIRNPLSKAYRAVRTLQCQYRLALTGTPIENSLVDLWAQVNFLNPGLLGGLKQFKKMYVFPIEKQNNELVRLKLKGVLAPFFMRRTKDEVAPELPSLTEVIHYTDMPEEQHSFYESIKSSVRNSILQSMTSNDRSKLNILILRGLMQLRLASIHPKLLDKTYEFESGKHSELRDMITQILQEGHKVLIFSQFVRHLNLIKEFSEFDNHKLLMFTGMTPSEERQGIISRFQKESDCQVLMMTLKAGGVGLNLTAADYILLVDPWWNPAAESQAIARAHRIGQDKKVFAYRFITKDSIEEKILVLQNRKRMLADEFIQNSNPLSTFTDTELIELFQ